jgi:eukaryotic-like serine/threonine-protein kinase
MIPLKLRLQMFVHIVQAVVIAHNAGVLHKDLKPANVLVSASTEDQVQIKLVDFGSASLLEPARLKELGITNMGLTQTGDLSHPLTGTLMYMAPEVFCGQPPTAASDVYALGVMFYQFVIGDFRKPLSPGWEGGVQDPLLRDDIAQSVCGDPAQRLTQRSGSAVPRS